MQSITLADQVYERLHADIVLGRLAPDRILLEDELAKQMQVSRTPVREALLRLAKDGLVKSVSRRWCVSQPEMDDIGAIYEVRAALEGYAARLAAERATVEQIDTIKMALDARGSAEGKIDESVATNEQFHRAIVEASGNPRLLAAIERNKHYYFNAQAARLYGPKDLVKSNAEHAELLAAVQARDPDRAEAVSRAHIGGALKLLEERLIPHGS